MLKQTTIQGIEHTIVLNPDVHVFELSATISVARSDQFPSKGLTEQVILYPTIEQAIQIRDNIDKVLLRLKAAKAEGVPLNPMLGELPNSLATA